MTDQNPEVAHEGAAGRKKGGKARGCGFLLLMVALVVLLVAIFMPGDDDTAEPPPPADSQPAEEPQDEEPAEEEPPAEEPEEPEEPAEPDPAEWAAEKESALKEGLVIDEFTEACPDITWACEIAEVRSTNVGKLDVIYQVAPGDMDKDEGEEKARRILTFLALADHDDLEWVVVYTADEVVAGQMGRSQVDGL